MSVPQDPVILDVYPGSENIRLVLEYESDVTVATCTHYDISWMLLTPQSQQGSSDQGSLQAECVGGASVIEIPGLLSDGQYTFVVGVITDFTFLDPTLIKYSRYGDGDIVYTRK